MIKIGCQGWNYPDWTTRDVTAPVFYPRGTRPGEMLPKYARVFDSTEIDSTFYAVPPVSNIEKWDRETPEGFRFSPKMPQEITHELRLGAESYPIVDEFCDRIRGFGSKLSVCLIQLGPQFEANKPNAVRLREFLGRLPRDIRFAVEFRRREWFVDWTYDELSRHGVSPALVEGKWIPGDLMRSWAGRLRSGSAYVRFMGERDLESFARIVRPQDPNLEQWARTIGAIEADEVLVYFSNLYEGHAPESARKLADLLDVQLPYPSILDEQATLF